MLHRNLFLANGLFIFCTLILIFLDLRKSLVVANDEATNPVVTKLQRVQSIRNKELKSIRQIEPTDGKKKRQLKKRVKEICKHKDKVLRSMIRCLIYKGTIKMFTEMRV